jgi:hypothetical protein
MRMPRGLVTLLVGVMLLALPTPRAAHAVLHAGAVAPDFSKTDLDGVVHTLSQYRGRVVVLFVLHYG